MTATTWTTEACVTDFVLETAVRIHFARDTTSIHTKLVIWTRDALRTFGRATTILFANLPFGTLAITLAITAFTRLANLTVFTRTS